MKPCSYDLSESLALNTKSCSLASFLAWSQEGGQPDFGVNAWGIPSIHSDFGGWRHPIRQQKFYWERTSLAHLHNGVFISSFSILRRRYSWRLCKARKFGFRFCFKIIGRTLLRQDVHSQRSWWVTWSRNRPLDFTLCRSSAQIRVFCTLEALLFINELNSHISAPL